MIKPTPLESEEASEREGATAEIAKRHLRQSVRVVWPVRPLFTATRLVHSTERIRRFATWLFVFLACATMAVAILPWQQSARGSGRVVAYMPGERQQEVLAPVKGVVARVPENLFEGAFVSKDTLLLEIQPAAAELPEQLKGQRKNLDAKIEAALIKANAYANNVLAYTSARDSAVTAAEQEIEAAKAKLAAKRKLLPGYQAKREQAELNFQRQEELNRQKITATKDLEYRRVDRDLADAEFASINEEILQAESELRAKEAELEQKRGEAQAKVDKATAEQQAALGEVETTRKDIRDLEIKQSELRRLEIRAPRDGYIQRLPVFAGGQTVKEGDYLLTFVPKTDDHAVELFVRGNDMPLVHPGDHVRLQFEGWPALQFSGWPSVAVGTFGGEVALVDPSDDGTGHFRVMVRPTENEPWPEEAYLRQGVRANGWVMLGTVSLAFEIWRQLNGFPPVQSFEDKASGGKDAGKRPKLPKS